MVTLRADVAIIGGTGLYNLNGSLEYYTEVDITTPWGKPSAPVVFCHTKSGKLVAFISRHGKNHEFSPSGVPYQANIAALKHFGVKTILSFSSVGSLQQEIAPCDFVIPNQVIDNTKGIRPSSFFGNGLVGHTAFGDPFDMDLHHLLVELSTGALEKNNKQIHSPKTKGKDITLICMEGPAFSTRAESNMYRMFGGDVINMSCLPEAKLAREAEISYQMVCMSTDYDSWRFTEEEVTVEAILANLAQNSSSAKLFLSAVLEGVIENTEKGVIGAKLKGSMRNVVTSTPAGRDPNMITSLRFIHKNYYK